MFSPPLRYFSSHVGRLFGFGALVLASAGAASLDLQAANGAGGGLYTTVVLLADGTVWTAGENTLGTIGVTPVVGSGRVRHNALSGVVSIAHGLGHVVAVTSSNTVYAWGSNAKAAFGATSPAGSTVPALIGSWPAAAAVAAGREQTYVLDTSGGVWAVGENSEGELGDGSYTDRTSPVQVSGLTSGVVAISAGSQHAIALKSDNTVWAWGRGNEGQLGDGLRTTSNIPVQVASLSSVTAISAGAFHNLAMEAGSLYAWGSNTYGQIGDNTNTRRDSPVPVSTGLGVSIVSFVAGYTHSLGVTSSNTVVGWGANGTYQLGLGHAADQKVPVAIPGPTGIVAVGAGILSHSSFAFASNGAVYGWGDNEFGRLGDGINNTDRKEPLDLAIAGGFWRAPNPDFSRWTAGSGNITVTNVLSSTPGLTMTYTTNGVDPTLSDAVILSGNTIAVTTPTTLKVRTFLSSMPDSGVSKAVY
jgi:alpha-tubulin suppressor-like RCC1 family protein